MNNALYAAAWLIISGEGYQSGVTAIPFPTYESCKMAILETKAVAGIRVPHNAYCIHGLGNGTQPNDGESK